MGGGNHNRGGGNQNRASDEEDSLALATNLLADSSIEQEVGTIDSHAVARASLAFLCSVCWPLNWLMRRTQRYNVTICSICFSLSRSVVFSP
jgi:hypothetical protein